MSMEVQAVYLGGNESRGYCVNVKTAHPKGNIGDAGVIRTFKSKDEAKLYANIVNETGQDVFTKKNKNAESPIRHSGDDFIRSSNETDETDCPKISWARAAFNRLTDEQIKSINETGRLPEGVKIVKNTAGDYIIANNYINYRPGTRTVPEGFEFKKDWLGFTVIVPKDTESFLIKNVA